MGDSYDENMSPAEILSTFFRIYGERGPEAALDYYFSMNKYFEVKKEELEKLKTQLRSFVTLLGNYIDFILIEEKESAGFLYHAVYLVRYDRQPVRFDFILYKPREKWVPQNVNFNDDVSRLV